MLEILVFAFKALHLLAALAFLAATFYLFAAAAGWRNGKWKRRLARAGLAALAGVLMPAAWWGMYVAWEFGRERQIRAELRERTEASSRVTVGDAAPPFTVVDTAGVEFDLVELNGKVVVLNFFATWCGPCLAELPLLDELRKKYRAEEDVSFLVIGRGETAEAVAAFRTEKALGLPMAADPDGEIYAEYAENLIPRTYLIGRGGKVAAAFSGYYPEDIERLEDEIDRQLTVAPRAEGVVAAIDR